MEIPGRMQRDMVREKKIQRTERFVLPVTTPRKSWVKPKEDEEEEKDGLIQ